MKYKLLSFYIFLVTILFATVSNGQSLKSLDDNNGFKKHKLGSKGDRTLKIEVGDMKDSLLIDELPWQSYDFDFAGLSFIWRALKNKRDGFWFHIADVAMINNAPKFVNKGRVSIKFVGVEVINGKACLKYVIDGIGIEDKGGHIWINPQSFMMEQYKILLPDEPGFENGMMQLVKTYKMNAGDWESFKRKRLGE